MNFTHLKTMTPEQLTDLHVRQIGRKPHPRAKPETIIKHIMESALLPQVNPKDQFKGEDMRPKALKPKAPEYNYTEADVREACAEFINKEGFEARFPGDDTVIFRYRGAEDSFNLKQPMKLIISRGRLVARGRLALTAHGTDMFERGTAGGGNAYTNVVLA